MGDSYQPVELTTEPDGEVRGYSPALNLYLCWNSTDRLETGEYRLRFWDPVTEKYLPDPLEIVEIAAELHQVTDERDQVMGERDHAMGERDQERSARIEAEAEIARLKEKLGIS